MNKIVQENCIRISCKEKVLNFVMNDFIFDDTWGNKLMFACCSDFPNVEIIRYIMYISCQSAPLRRHQTLPGYSRHEWKVSLLLLL